MLLKENKLAWWINGCRRMVDS